MIDALCLDLVTSHLKVKSPLQIYPFYMLIETHGSNNEHDEAKLNQFLENVMGEGLVIDGTTTNEPGKMRVRKIHFESNFHFFISYVFFFSFQAIWDLRERITEGLTHDGYVFKYDISLPTEQFYSLVPIMEKRMGDKAKRVCGYGHIGMLNISLPFINHDFCKLFGTFGKAMNSVNLMPKL